MDDEAPNLRKAREEDSKSRSSWWKPRRFRPLRKRSESDVSTKPVPQSHSTPIRPKHLTSPGKSSQGASSLSGPPPIKTALSKPLTSPSKSSQGASSHSGPPPI